MEKSTFYDHNDYDENVYCRISMKPLGNTFRIKAVCVCTPSNG